jgi:diaminohydroxyphosphoribosylaminopyrimidine deaminase/5-amino-6-(5-phosphoribosylamino)uracil reductase
MSKPADYMQRALDLAKLGQGFVAPNPMVGCVIVKNNQIIGEGWHKAYGGPHAEVNAIKSISEPNSPNGADVYVTLEPCSHFGKTPPCTDLLIASKVKKVYICNEDPNPLVSGKGIQKLLAAGIEVESGLLADQGNRVNRHFFTFHRQQRPYFTLKFATSKDQFLSQKNGKAVMFSNEMSRTLVHQLRTYHQAILVGVNTANWDNPQLTARYWQGNNPVRIILDPNNRINSDLHVLTDENPTWIFTKRVSKVEGNKIWFASQTKNADAFLSFVLQTLYQKNIHSILVEGGAATLQHFLDNQFVDEIIQIEYSKEIGEGITAPLINEQWKDIRKVGDDNLWKYWYRD